MEATTNKTVAENRRARYDYFILETFEAGIVLAGTEVKSLRKGQSSLNESYAGEIQGELFLINAHIPEYTQAGKAGSRAQHEIRRPRKLLLHRKEVDKLLGSIRREGMTIVPISIFFNGRGLAKVSLGLAKGKKQHDKRETEKKRDWQREKSRIMRDRG
jgi:SsrA-binding protein